MPPANPGAVRLGRIGQIQLPVRDLERAVAFYRDVLGVRFLFQAPPGLAFFDCDGVRLMLARPERAAEEHPGSVLYYKVEDIRAAYESLRTAGVRFIDEPHAIARMPDHELWMVFAHDTEENVLALMSEVRG